MKNVRLNRSKATAVGSVLAKLNIRPAFYERPFLRLDTGAEMKFKIYLFAAGICHQTYSLHHPGKNLYGWDFMEYAFIRMLENQSPLLDTYYLSVQNTAEIKKELIAAFAYDPVAQSCNLDRLDERARMLKEMGTWLEEEFGGKALDFLRSTGQRLYFHGKGYYETLPALEAFQDPMKKKATFFLKLARDAGVLDILDKEKLIPIMDYHMQRVLMRLGCVEIVDDNLYHALAERKPLHSDVEIRNVAIEAMRIIAVTSGHDLLVMNDFFWTHGRSCCNETMLCRDKVCEKDPCSFFVAVDLKQHKQCVFESVCKAAEDERYARLWQPVVDTNFY